MYFVEPGMNFGRDIVDDDDAASPRERYDSGAGGGSGAQPASSPPSWTKEAEFNPSKTLFGSGSVKFPSLNFSPSPDKGRGDDGNTSSGGTNAPVRAAKPFRWGGVAAAAETDMPPPPHRAMVGTGIGTAPLPVFWCLAPPPVPSPIQQVPPATSFAAAPDVPSTSEAPALAPAPTDKPGSAPAPAPIPTPALDDLASDYPPPPPPPQPPTPPKLHAAAAASASAAAPASPPLPPLPPSPSSAKVAESAKRVGILVRASSEALSRSLAVLADRRAAEAAMATEPWRAEIVALESVPAIAAAAEATLAAAMGQWLLRARETAQVDAQLAARVRALKL